jgi:hypothetical protein
MAAFFIAAPLISFYKQWEAIKATALIASH